MRLIRKLGEDRSSSSLGYKPSSNRQPGIEEANTGIESLRVPQGVGRRMGQDPGRQKYKDYSSRGMQAMPMQGISSLIPFNIGADRMGGPDRTLPGDILHMLENPSNYQSNFERMELENLQEDNIMNRLMIGEKFDPMIEAEELKRNPPYDGPSIMDLLMDMENTEMSGSTTNNMAGELIRNGIDTQGLNSDQIIQLYNQNFGNPDADVDQFGIAGVNEDNAAVQSLFRQGYSMEQIMNIMASRNV